MKHCAKQRRAQRAGARARRLATEIEPKAPPTSQAEIDAFVARGGKIIRVTISKEELNKSRGIPVYSTNRRGY